MKLIKPLIPALFAVLALPAWAQPAASATADFNPQTRPKLVVGIIVDQMRYDYLARFWDKFGDGGFKRLIGDGYLFTNHHLNYFPSYTAPGHASNYTGATPSVHGIVGNSWYSRQLGDDIVSVEDPDVDAVGAKIDQHASPVRLLSTTITDELKKTLPQAKVVSISLKPRGAILPGGHLADGAYWYDDDVTGDFISSSWYGDQLPPWLQAFNARDLPQQLSHKTWKPLFDLADYSKAHTDNNPYEAPFKSGDNATPTFPHPMAGSLDRIKSSPYGNQLLAELAKAAVAGAELGQDDVTDFLAISFSSTDYVGHRFGPKSVEVADTYARLDRTLAGLIEYLDSTVGKGRYLLFLTADHGVVQSPASLTDQGLPGGYFNPQDAVESLMDYLHERHGEGRWILEYKNQQVYLNHQLARQKGLPIKQLQQQAAQFLMQFDGVAGTNTATRLANLGYDDGLQAMYQNGFHEKRSGDVYIELEPGWLGYTKSKGTSHGSPYSYDTHIPLILYGWHVPHGVSGSKTVVTELAPTLAEMLHVSLPSGTSSAVLELK